MKFCVKQKLTMKEADGKRCYSIGEAAAIVHTTSETLRHYDRIGLVKPSIKNKWTNYRYYTDEDIVRLNTVRALQLMDLPLQEIKKVLEYDSLEEILGFLNMAEKKVDEKIEALQYSKSKIKAAKADYERKLQMRETASGIFIKEFPERVILLSDSLATPALDNLWNYLSSFYNQIPPELKEEFSFEDQAGIYTDDTTTRLFAVCTHYSNGVGGLKTLPAGKYLCLNCSETDKDAAIHKLGCSARKEYGISPAFIIQMIVLTGILQWNYHIQIFVGR